MRLWIRRVAIVIIPDGNSVALEQILAQVVPAQWPREIYRRSHLAAQVQNQFVFLPGDFHLRAELRLRFDSKRIHQIRRDLSRQIRKLDPRTGINSLEEGSVLREVWRMSVVEP